MLRLIAFCFLLLTSFNTFAAQKVLNIYGWTGEIPDAIVRRFEEETGYTGDFEEVTTCYDDAYSTMIRTVVIAKNCSKINDQALEQHAYADVHLVSLDDFRKILRSGEMTDVEVGYLALDHLDLL